MANIELSDRTSYCPVCTCCMNVDPSECPECLSPRPADGWEDVATSSYPYLGKRLDGRYIVDRFLGAGTTGDVYRGVGRRIQRPFALKIVDVQRYGNKDIEEEMLHRLEVEVDAMGRLRNPHVINVYESFQIRDHVFVLVMDYVEGVTLQERLERTGRLELDEAIEIIRQVANGLHEAHQRGIIHRDLKPENIMIEQMPASGIFARILDFGIAYMVGGARRTSGFRGTPLYASPEQCVSDGVIDPRSDVYSLGCVLFHCLTGRPPYESDRSLAVMEAHIEADVPSVFDIVSPTAVPRRVDEMLRRLLAKDPDQRPADCGEVVELLDEIDLSKDSREFDPRELDSGSQSALAEQTSPHLGDTDSEMQRRQRVVHMVASLRVPARIDTAPGNITASALGPGGDYAVLADRAKKVHLVGIKTHLRTMSFGGAEEMITAVVIDSNRGDVYAAGFDSRVIRWNLNLTTGLPRRVVDVADRILAIDIDHKGARLALGTERGRTLLYDLRTERLTELYQAPSPVSTIRFAADTGRLFVGCWEGQLKTLDLDGSRELAELASLKHPPRSAAVDPDGHLAAVVDEAGKLRVLNLLDASAFLEIEATVANLRALSFSRDGKLNGLGISGEDLQLWLVRNENVLQHLSERNSSAVLSS